MGRDCGGRSVILGRTVERRVHVGRSGGLQMLKRPVTATVAVSACLMLALASGVRAQSPSAASESPGLPAPSAEASMSPAVASPSAEASASLGAESPAVSQAATSAEPSTGTTGSPAAESPAASAGAGLPPNCTVVANDLLNPRGLSIGPDGTLYVAEAGSGGTTPDFADNPVPGASFPAAPVASGEPGAASPAANASGAPQVTTHGDTGRVTAIAPDGTQKVVVDGLTSYVFGDEVVGPAKVAIGQDGTLYVSIGGPGPGTAFLVPAGVADSVVSVAADGTVSQVANIGQY